MFSNVGVDFKIYLDEITLDFDERGLLYTVGGIMKRFKYDSFKPAADLHDFSRDVIDQFLSAEYGSLEETFDPGARCRPVRSAIRLCLFELDGMLLDTTDLAEMAQRLLPESEISPSPSDIYLTTIAGGRSEKDYL